MIEFLKKILIRIFYRTKADYLRAKAVRTYFHDQVAPSIDGQIHRNYQMHRNRLVRLLREGRPLVKRHKADSDKCPKGSCYKSSGRITVVTSKGRHLYYDSIEELMVYWHLDIQGNKDIGVNVKE